VRSQRHAPAAFTPGKDPVPIVQDAEWASGPVWTGAKNLKKSKAIPVPEVSRSLRLPDFRQSEHEGGKFVSSLTPGNIPLFHFCYTLNCPRAKVRPEDYVNEKFQ